MDETQIIALKKDLEGHYSAMKAQMKTARDYYHGEYKVKKPKNYEAYKPATAANKIDVATDHIIAIGRKVAVPYWGQSEKVKETAGRVEKFGQNYLSMMERTGQVNPVRAMVKNAMLYGMFCLKGPLYRQDAWPKEPKLVGLRGQARKDVQDEYEQKRARTFPFHNRAVNPLNLLVDPTMEVPGFIIEEFGRKAITLKGLYPEVDLSQYADNAELAWWEWWTEKEYCYFIGDRPLGKGIWENWLGFLPYEVGYSGLGEEAPDGAPEKRAVPIIQNILSGLKAEARIKTAMIVGLETNVYGRPTIAEPPQADIRMGSAPGEVNVIPDRYKYRNEAPAPLNPDALRVIAMVEADNDTGTFASILEGERPAGVSSGYFAGVLTGQTRVRLEGSVNAAENVLSKNITNVGILVRDVIDEPVTVFGFHVGAVESETVGPDDFKTLPQAFVRFDGKTPEERDRRIALGLQILTAGALPKPTVVKDFMDYDPVEQRNIGLVEELLRDPRVREAMAAALVKDFGMEQYLGLLREQQASAKAEARNAQPQEMPQLAPGAAPEQPPQKAEIMASLAQGAPLPNPAGLRTQQRLDSGQPRTLGSPAEGAPV